MKRILLHLAISVLAFGLGVTVSDLWRSYIPVDVPQPFLADASNELPFPVISLECIRVGCGPHNTKFSYGLSDGGYITRTCQEFPSFSEVHSALHARHPNGPEIIEWSTNLDSNGQAIGETVLVFDGATAVRLSTYGLLLCETRASSLNDLRWFENGEFH